LWVLDITSGGTIINARFVLRFISFSFLNMYLPLVLQKCHDGIDPT
jgi:hypothetical protein